MVIPAHNEERLIGRTLRGVPAYVDHVVVVDDASDDTTYATTARFPDPRVRVHARARNGGVGAAILDGYNLAGSLGVDVIVVVGGDAQMDPSDMAALLDEVVGGRADYAKGARLDHPEILRRMPLVRLAGNLALSALTRTALGRADVRDSQCGYTALSATWVPRLPCARLYKRYGFPNDLLSSLLELGATVREVPVAPIYGDEQSGIRLSRTVAPLLGLLARIWWRHHVGSARASRQEAGPCAC